MAAVIKGLPALSPELALFHTTDPLLGNSPVLVFHGPAATIATTSSRIQVHVFTPAGVASYTRLSVAPTSQFYSAVRNLPREEQGDEVCRGITFGLKKYFSELQENVKKTWRRQVKTPSPGALFGDDHIAILATRMTRIENVCDVITNLSDGFCEQYLSWLDIDVVLPPGSIKARPSSASADELDDAQLLKCQYGQYAGLIASLGETAFLPTSRIRRAPSKATAMGRSAAYTKSQRDIVNKEIAELLHTEESYVGRLEELRSLAQDIKIKIQGTDHGHLEVVFPPAIDQLVEINTKFLTDLQATCEHTLLLAEENCQMSQEIVEHMDMTSATSTEVQGVVAIGKCLSDWFPRFSNLYKEYTSTHARASQTLRKLLRNGGPRAAALQEIGEQKLTSLLIEPVQRLPRYNLYIDSISKQLPARHPGLRPLLKARDIITAICAEKECLETSEMIERLRSRTLDWPDSVQISGRLVTAADYVELMPPYSLEKCSASHGILLLFTDGIIVVHKSANCRTTSRSLLTELENPSLPNVSAESLADTAGDFIFMHQLPLSAVHCTQSHDDHTLQLLFSSQLAEDNMTSQESAADLSQVCRLQNSYDGKASRFVEEICKARVENRFSEAERDSLLWDFRSTEPMPDAPGLFIAVMEDSNRSHVKARRGTASIRIKVDPDHWAGPATADVQGPQAVISLTASQSEEWNLSVASIDGTASRESVTSVDLLPALRRRLTALAACRLSLEQPWTVNCFLTRNFAVLQSIELHAASKDDNEIVSQLNPRNRVHRSKSPKKLLSSFLSSVGSGSEAPNPLRRELREAFALPTQSLSSRTSTVPRGRPPSRDSRPVSREQAINTSFSSVSSEDSQTLRRLEDTLSTYLLALQARKGNVVGKNLKLRHNADRSLVDEVYSSLLEDANMMVVAAQAPLDVLFAAFEKFLTTAWEERLGPVMPLYLVQDIQSKAETMFPSDFDVYFRTTLVNLAPPNQRAFKSIINLLVELLDGTGNDSDRGILTSCFADILITGANSHDYIALIDRFVDDTDTYFGEPMEERRNNGGSAHTHKRARSVNSSSLTSNTSSLRRKFGFSTLSRENSKSEQESKVTSVWRSLSKTNRTDTSPHNSISKATLGRSQSIDDGRRAGGFSLPQDNSKAEVLAEMDAMPTSEHRLSGSALETSTINKQPSLMRSDRPRKKRRSSLSDLKSLESTPKREPFTPDPRLRPPVVGNKDGSGEDIAPSSPTTPTSKSNGAKRISQASPRSRLPASFRQDLPSEPNKEVGRAALPHPRSHGCVVDEVIITATPTSNIPTPMSQKTSPSKHVSTVPARTGLSERPGAGNIVKQASSQADKGVRSGNRNDTLSSAASLSSGIPTRKLRVQSPQKIRERLQNEQNTLATTSKALQDELSRIGEELTSRAEVSSSARGSRTIAGQSSSAQPSSMDLAQRVLKMEGKLPQHIEELSGRVSALQADLYSSLGISEAKCKKLDELYREANAENQALYVRFNDELERIVENVRRGDGVAELKAQLRDSQEETAKLRREMNRLKRENAGLRAQLAE